MINIPYCLPQEVRDITGLTTSELTDAQISGIIAHAAVQLNADIQVYWENEQIVYIDTEKQNQINGSNTTYYTQHYPIGDRDNDGMISGIDVYAYTIDSSGARTQIVATTIGDSDIGKFTLASAPSDVVLYTCYYSAPVNMETPHPLVKLACMQLAASLCYTRVDAGKVQSYRVGKIAKMEKRFSTSDMFRKQYIDTINKIRRKLFKADRGTETL